MDLNKPALRAWVEKLESGTIPQGSGCLAEQHTDGVVRMCCLGVATDQNAGHLGLEKRSMDMRYEGEWEPRKRFFWDGEQAILPHKVAEFLGVEPNFYVTEPETGFRKPIASLNDAGRTFPELAAMIRKEFEL